MKKKSFESFMKFIFILSVMTSIFSIILISVLILVRTSHLLGYMDIKENEITCFIGLSGCGKSSLLAIKEEEFMWMKK